MGGGSEGACVPDSHCVWVGSKGCVGEGFAVGVVLVVWYGEGVGVKLNERCGVSEQGVWFLIGKVFYYIKEVVSGVTVCVVECMLKEGASLWMREGEVYYGRNVGEGEVEGPRVHRGEYFSGGMVVWWVGEVRCGGWVKVRVRWEQCGREIGEVGVEDVEDVGGKRGGRVR